jgi:hypothetical protein
MKEISSLSQVIQSIDTSRLIYAAILFICTIIASKILKKYFKITL